MKKIDAEKAIRSLCHEWAKIRSMNVNNSEPNFYEFLSWLENNYSSHLKFRTSVSVSDDIERWFDQELKQTWRN